MYMSESRVLILPDQQVLTAAILIYRLTVLTFGKGGRQQQPETW